MILVTDDWFTGLIDHRQLVLGLVPMEIKPYVRGDVRISDDVFLIEEWLTVNRHGKAILITMPHNKGAALPSRCVRAKDVRKAVRLVHGGL